MGATAPRAATHTLGLIAVAQGVKAGRQMSGGSSGRVGVLIGNCGGTALLVLLMLCLPPGAAAVVADARLQEQAKKDEQTSDNPGNMHDRYSKART